MRRASFLMLGAAPLLFARRAQAQSDVDPAQSSTRQALRVLLGSGDVGAVPGSAFIFNGKSYRGTFERTSDGRIVNIVDLEAYLYSVVSREMPSAWPAAALETQAICARTYVLQRSDPRRAYDLVPSELDQLYDGIAGETPTGVAAVEASAGRVLSFEGSYAQVAYSSCCGGRTESSADAWGKAPIPYLDGVVCIWCSDSPNFRWNRSLALDAIGSRLTTSLPPFSRLNDLRVAERDPSGRVRTFELIGDRSTAIVSGTVFRRSIGPRVLPSLMVRSLQRTADGTAVAMDGGGLGHGVGLCQWGARGMALSGSAAEAILALYFPGTVVENLR